MNEFSFTQTCYDNNARIQEFSVGLVGAAQVNLSKIKVSPDNFVVGFFFKEKCNFPRFQRRSNIFQGGPTFSRGEGVQLLLPYRNPYILLFSGARVWTPCPPTSGSAHDKMLYISRKSYLSYDMRFTTCGMCDQQRLRPACAYAQSDPGHC